MQRFYKKASAAAQDGAFSILLDGRPVRTPGKGLLHLPAERLADAIAAEWEAQGERIEPATMPLMQLASTAIDRVAPQKEGIILQVARYGETDLVCYRAEGPETLTERQEAVWSPLLAWLEDQLGAALAVTAGIQPVPQPPEAIRALREAAAALGAFPLAGLSSATSTTGSVVIGLALVHGRISAAEAAEAAFVDEIYQMDQWGADEQEQTRLARLTSDLVAVERFLALLD